MSSVLLRKVWSRSARRPRGATLTISLPRDFQRSRAAELDVALGLFNACLKRAIKKGLVKLGQAPARRYAYYLTPQGFSEKSRLTIEYLSSTFSLFRKSQGGIKEEYGRIFERARALGFQRVALAGKIRLCLLSGRWICGGAADK
jgi:hypothetical protein